VEHAGELAGWGVRQVTLVHVVESPDRSRLAKELLELAGELIAAREVRLREQGLEVRSRVEVGPPGKVLCDVAEQLNPSLIVMGAHGKGLWKRALLGSTSDSVMRASRWPVLLVRVALLGGKAPERLFDLGSVLYPTDFSDNAAAVLRCLKGLRGVGRVMLLHVQERARVEPYLSERLEEFNRIDTERLDIIRGELREAGVPTVDLRVELGDATESILHWAERGGFALVALGLRGRTLLDDIFIGSVAANLARYSPQPLLLVPRQAKP
jgi:nucleotide-binding universal stress UspA family protein